MQFLEDYFNVQFVSTGFNFRKNVTFPVNGVNGIIPSILEYVSSPVLTASSATQPIYTFPNDGTTWKVFAVSARFTTASSSGTAQVELAAAATAPGSGTNQLTGTLSLAGTANTAVNGTIIASPTTASAGYSLNVVLGGTLTSLAGCIITVALQRLS